jgi:hypothetical protein
MDLLTKKKPINFTEDDVIDTETLVRFINKDKKKGQKKETFSSIVRDRAIREIKRELKRIEKGK